MLNKWLSGKNGYLLGFVASYALVALALWIQTHYSLNPCPLCISQRIVFMALGLLFLCAACINPNTLLHKTLTLLLVLTALGGAAVAIRHWWLQAHRDSMIADCGVGFDYMFENFPLQKALTLVFRGTGDCAEIDWTFLGLSIPQMSFLAFIGFVAYALYLTKK
ncbi:MAG: disulfide bond formation protein B [Methylotenera sp.]|nr:disulfide bond formation protein B [Methylotenera sp.]MSP98978.1 disulfide bond formation protein B [Methylotenera sp.]